MNFRVLRVALFSILLPCTTWVVAGEPADEAIVAKLTGALQESSSGLQVQSIETSEIPGLYAVQFTNGPLVYADGSGEHFVVGDMYQVQPRGFVNLAEQRRDGDRKDKIAAVERDDMIVFSPAEEPKAFITVFTDVTCFYCQKLHKEVPELNKRGVEVRYLAYPRAGVGSEGYQQLASAWCSDNPAESLTKLKNKQSVPNNVCAGNPIADQFQLGQELGVRGTPAIITESGLMIPGYQSADDLMVTLGLE
jgi:thiol:disulfide interchange protein DsbC